MKTTPLVALASVSALTRSRRIVPLPDGHRQMTTMLPRRLVLPLFLFCVAFLARPSAATPFQWDFTGSLNIPRVSHTATLLPNGKVLVAAGGSNQDGVSDTAELYDPGSGTWAYTGRLTASRNYHTATLLSNGKVLVAGGYHYPDRLASAEVYDPGSSTWHVTGSLAVARSSHSAVLLHDGRVLVAAGVDGSTVAELYDPATGTWSQTGSLSIARNEGQTMTTLADGKVLIVGGGYELATAELWDPATGLWTPTGSLTPGDVRITPPPCSPTAKCWSQVVTIPR